jgi:hypothetical protein
MTDGDMEFMRKLGIVPCRLGASPSFSPQPPPTEVPIPKLTAEDARWLLNLGVVWEHEVEPDFIPPKTLREYLACFPTGIREAVEAVAHEMGLALRDSGLDNLAQEITRMFFDFAALGLEDIVELYGFYKSMHPGECGATGFHAYIRFRVAACVPVVLRDDPLGEN